MGGRRRARGKKVKGKVKMGRGKEAPLYKKQCQEKKHTLMRKESGG